MAKKRKNNTTLDGISFTDDIKLKVWEKAATINGKNSSVWRKDKYGTIINFTQYGNQKSPYGWHIDHQKPLAEGGTDHINNLQPLFWYRNILKADYYPYTKTLIKVDDALVDNKITLLKKSLE